MTDAFIARIALRATDLLDILPENGRASCPAGNAEYFGVSLGGIHDAQL